MVSNILECAVNMVNKEYVEGAVTMVSNNLVEVFLVWWATLNCRCCLVSNS